MMQERQLKLCCDHFALWLVVYAYLGIGYLVGNCQCQNVYDNATFFLP